MNRLSIMSKVTLGVLAVAIIFLLLNKPRYVNRDNGNIEEQSRGTMTLIEETEVYEIETDDPHKGDKIINVNKYGYVSVDIGDVFRESLIRDGVVGALIDTAVDTTLFYSYVYNGQTITDMLDVVSRLLKTSVILQEVRQKSGLGEESGFGDTRVITYKNTSTNVLYIMKLLSTNWQGIPVTIGVSAPYADTTNVDALLNDSNIGAYLSRLTFEDYVIREGKQDSVAIIDFQLPAEE